MQRIIKQWLMFGLAVGVFASCSQEGNEPNSTAEVGGETVSFSLSAEVSVDDPRLRAIDYKLGNNANGELVPMPQFVDKQEVEVHTILKSSNGAVAAKTLKWRYSAASKKLVLSQNDGHSITVSGFNNDNGVKWYVSGLIGGELIPNTTRVTFAGERVLKGVDGNDGDIVGSLNVPYAFGWTELTINTGDARGADDSHKYAEAPASKDVKFKPMGSLIAYKLGNAQVAGSYTFSPKGFTVASNAWGDQGEFELSTDIPTANPEKALPLWTESSCGSNMYYTFADGHIPSVISHGSKTDKAYYAWVISHKKQPAKADVHVMLKGESSRPETATYKDYTKTWFTDYNTEGKTTQGRVVQGKVHKLTAKAIRRVSLPIEYVTDYNLAGGEGLTYTTVNFTNPQPAGVQGPLRFADSHDNDQSGYYNWYKVKGLYHAEWNSNTRNLSEATLIDTDGSAIILGDKYFIPTLDNWHGIYPFWPSVYWARTEETLDEFDLIRIGVGNDTFRQIYSSDYSRGFISPRGGSNETDNAVLYAIRFKKRECSITYDWDYDNSLGAKVPYTYTGAIDNSMKCAYRFTRVGGYSAWNKRDSHNLATRIVIDVVYLGEENNSTELSTISDETWWAMKQSEGSVFSKVFPAPGMIDKYASSPLSETSGPLSIRGYWGYYWTANLSDPSSAFYVGALGSNTYSYNMMSLEFGFPVRLFTKPIQ